MKQLFALMAVLGLTVAQIGCGETATEEPTPETPAAAPGDADATPADAADETPAEDAAEDNDAAE